LFFVSLFNVHFKEISMNAIAQTSVATAAAPTEKQVLRLTALGATAIPSTRSEASQLISKLIASRDMQPATLAQVGRAAALGGRDLPGAGVREKSTQIYLLEALAAWDNAEENDAKAVNDAVALLVSRVRERMVKPLTITITAPAEQAPM
jgi:hypothetical protein